MSRNLQSDTRTLAYVLRRTNYGEADRILNLITPDGKRTAMAKAVRKEKSKLAGGVEMFSLVELTIHQGKSEFGTVTSAKMLKYYDQILADLNRMELASLVLRKISVAADASDSPEYFKIVDSALASLNRRTNCGIVEAWFFLNYARAMGEQINLYRDVTGEKLTEDKYYYWDDMEAALTPSERGDVNADIIKIMRLMLSTNLDVVERVKGINEMWQPILRIARAVNKT